jgi:DNA-binding CsgD family transcriptional regulator
MSVAPSTVQLDQPFHPAQPTLALVPVEDPIPGRRRRRRRRGPGGLTRRELEILRHVATGATNREVAAKLWVTDQTVKFHLSNVYRKLGVSNRFEASRWAWEQGLLGEPQDISQVEQPPLAPLLTVTYGK